MKAIILAAGKGTRLNCDKTDLPKSMHLVKGRPIIGYVFDTLGFLDKKDIIAVVKYKKEKIMQAYPDILYVEQGDDGYGTGYAVECALEALNGYKGDLIVICGDTPLVTRETLCRMIELHRREGNACTVLSCKGKEGLALGRMVRDPDGKLLSIVEHKDCTEEQRKICEYNAATYVFDSEQLFAALKEVANSRATGEKYLTDVPEILMKHNRKVNAYLSDNDYEILGINSAEDLLIVEKALDQLAGNRA